MSATLVCPDLCATYSLRKSGTLTSNASSKGLNTPQYCHQSLRQPTLQLWFPVSPWTSPALSQQSGWCQACSGPLVPVPLDMEAQTSGTESAGDLSFSQTLNEVFRVKSGITCVLLNVAQRVSRPDLGKLSLHGASLAYPGHPFSVSTRPHQSYHLPAIFLVLTAGLLLYKSGCMHSSPFAEVKCLLSSKTQIILLGQVHRKA
jgi:hypothetical protein